MRNFPHAKTLKRLYLLQSREGLNYSHLSNQFQSQEVVERSLERYERISELIERLEHKYQEHRARVEEISLALSSRPSFLDDIGIGLEETQLTYDTKYGFRKE